MKNKTNQNVLLSVLMLCALVQSSCSSTQNATSDSFNADAYYNPYENQLNIKERALRRLRSDVQSDTLKNNFTPAEMVGGLGVSVRYTTTIMSSGSMSNMRQNSPPIMTPHGTYVFKLFIDETGELRRIITLRSDGSIYGAKMKKGLRQAHYKPGKLNEKPIKSILKLIFKYQKM